MVSTKIDLRRSARAREREREGREKRQRKMNSQLNTKSYSFKEGVFERIIMRGGMLRRRVHLIVSARLYVLLIHERDPGVWRPLAGSGSGGIVGQERHPHRLAKRRGESIVLSPKAVNDEMHAKSVSQ
jgi:hypothetical protein